MLLAVLGIACMFIPGLLQAEGMRRVGAQRAAIGSTIGPPTTIFLAALFLDERLNGWQLLGSAMIVGSVLVLSVMAVPRARGRDDTIGALSDPRIGDRRARLTSRTMSHEELRHDPRKIEILVHALRQGDRARHRPARDLRARASPSWWSWAVSGPLFHWSDTWQLVINTGTTIVTFLMVFLIQSTQNRDAEAVQVKLDELLRVTAGAHNVLMNLEELEEHELERIRAVYVKLAEKARQGVDDGRSDEGAGHRRAGREAQKPSAPTWSRCASTRQQHRFGMFERFGRAVDHHDVAVLEFRVARGFAAEDSLAADAGERHFRAGARALHPRACRCTTSPAAAPPIASARRTPRRWTCHRRAR